MGSVLYVCTTPCFHGGKLYEEGERASKAALELYDGKVPAHFVPLSSRNKISAAQKKEIIMASLNTAGVAYNANEPLAQLEKLLAEVQAVQNVEDGKIDIPSDPTKPDVPAPGISEIM